MPIKGFKDRLKDIKLVLATAKEALTGIGIPGVEPIAGLPLLILKYYEVCALSRGSCCTGDNCESDALSW